MPDYDWDKWRYPNQLNREEKALEQRLSEAYGSRVPLWVTGEIASELQRLRTHIAVLEDLKRI